MGVGPVGGVASGLAGVVMTSAAAVALPPEPTSGGTSWSPNGRAGDDAAAAGTSGCTAPHPPAAVGEEAVAAGTSGYTPADQPVAAAEPEAEVVVLD